MEALETKPASWRARLSDTDYKHLILIDSKVNLPLRAFLFSLDHPVPPYLTGFIFYMLAPVVLAVMTWKAAARFAWGALLALLTGMVTVSLAFLDIRRCPPSQRRENSQNAESQQAMLGFANLQDAKLGGASRVG
jgi:hypothetical protein